MLLLPRVSPASEGDTPLGAHGRVPREAAWPPELGPGPAEGHGEGHEATNQTNERWYEH